jgi:predicted negative regulator of RcsB-dependent stress response
MEIKNFREAAEMIVEVHDENYDKLAHDISISELRQALAQPEQEPVGYVTDSGMSAVFIRGTNLDDDTPLYTAPPKREWKGLTSDDKHFLLASAWNKEQAFDGFMEAIDKFLEEKNT